MESKIYYTIQDYENRYRYNLMCFVDENNSELDFLNSELKLYKSYAAGLREQMNNSSDDISSMLKDLRVVEKITKIDKIIDFIEIGIFRLEEVKKDMLKTQENKTRDTDKLLINTHNKIFSSDFAYTLFDKMKGFYNKESIDLANYSFLFYAMQKDNFVICTNIDFVKLLFTYNIYLDKIDSRQSGKNKKLKLYDSIKESLQEKHNLSTKPCS
ncbi:MAG TPA: hypothetical protein VIV55_06595 [Flavobacterium sp.]